MFETSEEGGNLAQVRLIWYQKTYFAKNLIILNDILKIQIKKKCLSRLIHIHINMKNTVRAFLFYLDINTRVSKYNKTKLIDIFLKNSHFSLKHL